MENKRRLIDAEKLEERMGDLCDEFDTDHLFIDAIIYEIENAPTMDAVEVVHGRWEYQPPTITLNASWKCSACNKVFWEHILETRYFSYCPNCGAKMDK